METLKDRLKKNLEQIKALVVERDPDNNDKILERIWNTAESSIDEITASASSSEHQTNPTN